MGVLPLSCPICNVPKPIRNIFFECQHSILVWSTFMGSPLCWNSHMGLPWIEVLEGYIDSFDDKLISFGLSFLLNFFGSFGKKGMKKFFRTRRVALLSLTSNSQIT